MYDVLLEIGDERYFEKILESPHVHLIKSLVNNIWYLNAFLM